LTPGPALFYTGESAANTTNAPIWFWPRLSRICYDDIMSQRALTSIGVAEAKRRFADVLGAVRYRGERFVVERNGTPMAAVVPISEVEEAAGRTERPGFLALVGAFDDEPEYAASLADVVHSRRTQRSRPAPRL
jgi:prevent-host-death family protein